LDKERFYEAVESVRAGERKTGGIGTRGEKTVHAAIKNYLNPDYDGQEVKIGGYTADIVGEDGIIEIQTGGFEKLRKKLKAFLGVARVTLAHPVICEKWIINISPETGEILNRRKSPGRGGAYDVFYELYKIKEFINDDNFRLMLLLIDAEEIRVLNTLKRRNKYSVSDRIPINLREEILISDKSDWGLFIPRGLPEKFSSKDFSSAAGIGIGAARTALNILSEVSAVERVGKKGNSIIYVSRAQF
jgi:hypothetical protein